MFSLLKILLATPLLAADVGGVRLNESSDQPELEPKQTAVPALTLSPDVAKPSLRATGTSKSTGRARTSPSLTLPTKEESEPVAPDAAAAPEQSLTMTEVRAPLTPSAVSAEPTTAEELVKSNKAKNKSNSYKSSPLWVWLFNPLLLYWLILALCLLLYLLGYGAYELYDWIVDQDSAAGGAVTGEDDTTAAGGDVTGEDDTTAAGGDVTGEDDTTAAGGDRHRHRRDVPGEEDTTAADLPGEDDTTKLVPLIVTEREAAVLADPVANIFPQTVNGNGETVTDLSVFKLKFSASEFQALLDKLDRPGLTDEKRKLLGTLRQEANKYVKLHVIDNKTVNPYVGSPQKVHESVHTVMDLPWAPTVTKHAGISKTDYATIYLNFSIDGRDRYAIEYMLNVDTQEHGPYSGAATTTTKSHFLFYTLDHADDADGRAVYSWTFHDFMAALERYSKFEKPEDSQQWHLLEAEKNKAEPFVF